MDLKAPLERGTDKVEIAEKVKSFVPHRLIKTPRKVEIAVAA